MLHLKVRAARHAAGLSLKELSDRTGVPRSTLQEFEAGQNVTLATARKVAAALPDLRQLALVLDGADLVEAADVEKARAAMADLLPAVHRLVDVLGQPLPSAPAPPVGATRVEPTNVLDDDTLQRIAAIDAAVDGGAIEPDKDS